MHLKGLLLRQKQLYNQTHRLKYMRRLAFKRAFKSSVPSGYQLQAPEDTYFQVKSRITIRLTLHYYQRWVTLSVSNDSTIAPEDTFSCKICDHVLLRVMNLHRISRLKGYRTASISYYLFNISSKPAFH